ncbi:hypothetical protein [Cesiribacter andamanensis]|uniref:Uncharacterized protein n=1 Tax=Cesiribacter andamanensis AMV16 TaxID=1279009 RepID=M7NJ30_9BACT|nr:hypothetical protein [Cesiribacter andamanensis]EMR01755.1 hypothetical protein ADICEAN_03114 [Cesiribacter andamanensis AMV16]
MALISRKKKIYPISRHLRAYLRSQEREAELPITYKDLLRYDNSIALYDRFGADTLWETVFYPQSEMETIYQNLKKIYAELKAQGDYAIMDHLSIDRVDVCVYGNTKPFRVRIVNNINDNFDYFYIKQADASRIYGLELEHLLSPNRINYVVHDETLIEEHIAGIPGDEFIRKYLQDKTLNEIRLAKEFVKFNERCFVRLLGDMHSNNFVIEITPDFEEIHYRIRAIDFDQQSYEGRRAVYMPQYFKQNNPIIEVGIRNMTPTTMAQYQKEERALIANRILSSKTIIKKLIRTMMHDELAPQDHVESLRQELAKFYSEPDFLECRNMGEILRTSLSLLVQKVKL